MTKPMILAALCLAAVGALPASAQTAPAPSAAPANPLVGTYRLQGGPDTVSLLELGANGRFRFMLSAGAVDFHAEGNWRSTPRAVILTTQPRPVPAAFTAGAPTRDDGPFHVLVADPQGRGLAGIDLRVGFADGGVVEGYTQDDGWTLPDRRGRAAPAWIELALAMYNIPPQRFPIDPAAGNRLAFTFVPNDFQVFDFDNQALDISGTSLIIHGPGGDGTYVREAARATSSN